MPGFRSLDTAYAVREAMERLSREILNRERPEPRYGTVESIASAGKTAQVILQGDTTSVRVRTYRGCQPSAVGDIVRVEGKPGNLYVSEVVSGRPMTDGALASEFSLSSLDSYADGATTPRGLPRKIKTSWSFEHPAPGPTNTVHLGRWSSSVAEAGLPMTASMLEIIVTGRGYNYNSKKYSVPYTVFSGQDSVWTKLVPTDSSQYNLGNDFQLEIRYSTFDYSFELRIRSTADYGDRGYRVLVESVGGGDIEYDGSSAGTVTTAPAEPTATYSTEYLNAGARLPASPAASFPWRAQTVLTGGGNITWDGTNLLWGTRFIVMGLGRSYFATGGYFEITCPTSGSITVVGGSVGSVTATASGIPLGNWQALYYRLPYGGSTASNASNFIILDYLNRWNGDGPGSDWVLVAVKNGDAGVPSLRLGTGELLDHWRAPTLVNSWANYGSPYPDAGYRLKDGGSTIELKGLVRYGTAATIFTLPAGYRPADQQLLVTLTNTNVLGRFDVTTAGAVNLSYTGAGNNGYVTLSGLSFPRG